MGTCYNIYISNNIYTAVALPFPVCLAGPASCDSRSARLHVPWTCIWAALVLLEPEQPQVQGHHGTLPTEMVPKVGMVMLTQDFIGKEESHPPGQSTTTAFLACGTLTQPLNCYHLQKTPKTFHIPGQSCGLLQFDTELAAPHWLQEQREQRDWCLSTPRMHCYPKGSLTGLLAQVL